MLTATCPAVSPIAAMPTSAAADHTDGYRRRDSLRPGIIAKRYHPDTTRPTAPEVVRDETGGVAYACVPSGTRRYYYPVYTLPNTPACGMGDAQACWGHAFAPPPAGARVRVSVGGARMPATVRGYVSHDGWLRPIVRLERRPTWWREAAGQAGEGDAEWYMALGDFAGETPLPAIHPVEVYDPA